MAKIIKKPKFIYYLQGYLRYLLPQGGFARKIGALSRTLPEKVLAQIDARVQYYCRLDPQTHYPLSGSRTLADLRPPVSPKVYYLDTYETARFFPRTWQADWVFGDVSTLVPTASWVKTRPITPDNTLSVLLKLDKNRHFIQVAGDKPFTAKKDKLIGYGGIHQPHRIRFFEQYFGHPLCELGHVARHGGKAEWYRPKIGIGAHLDYKFILSLQGNDVASNLKWIMSSNSLPVMPRPTVESWFMEGQLRADEHFVAIRDDYSDLEERLEYWLTHPKEAGEIIARNHEYCRTFANADAETLCALKVMEKYFRCTGSIPAG